MIKANNIPKAPHITAVVSRGSDVEIKLLGYDVDGDKLTATIASLPSVGKVYQLSQVYNTHGYLPKYEEKNVVSEANTLVTGSSNRVVFVLPAGTQQSQGKWATFTYVVHDGISTSAEGVVTLVPPGGALASSDFTLGSDGWAVVNNGNGGGLVHEMTSFGMLNHFVYGTDMEINVDVKTGDDKDRWYFQAPAQFLGFQASAYGGSLEFALAAFSGDLKTEANLNRDRDVVVLECRFCAGGNGMRFVIRDFDFTGESKLISIPLLETAGWLKDPRNTLATWTIPSKCEMVEMLHELSALRILGDYTKWYETVGLDNVKLVHKGEGFKHAPPVECLCKNPGTQCPALYR